MGLTSDNWKRGIDDYLSSAKGLFESMSSGGFSPFYAVPIDIDKELLDGSHRLALALLLGHDVPVVISTKRVWAPPWGMEWFEAKGMAKPDLERLADDWERLTH